MIEFKEKYPNIPHSNQWGAALERIVCFIGALQKVVQKIDARVANLESDYREIRKEDAA